MAASDGRFAAAVRRVLGRAHLMPPDGYPGMVADVGAAMDALEAHVYVADRDEAFLVPLTAGSDSRPQLPIDGTLAGRAFTDASLHVARSGDRCLLWVPMLDGTDRIGVLQLVFPADVSASPEELADAEHLATLLTEILVARMSYGDRIEIARRQLPMSLPSELQWHLLPPLTFATPRVAIAGALAPTYEVAGDSFDYAVNGDTAHLAVVDAMGHGLEAALMSVVVIGAFRNARRSGLGLVDTVRSMDKAVASTFGIDRFVTAVVGELDIASGHYRYVACGHPPALLLRRGRIVKTLGATVHPPLGLLGAVPEADLERLEPGDRVVLYTDGVVEARNADGEFFGIERLADLVVRESAAGLPAPETLRRLKRAILAHQEDELQDDATTLLVEWAGAEHERMVP